ncbi:hypothetical protein LBC_07200 [Campylobacter sp. 19-13652]|nr:hypothetical protein LBC_07200 [Campylobacter sp. 19-13652]
MDTKKRIRKFLFECGKSKRTIESYFCGSRRPDGDTRELIRVKFKIPTSVWGDRQKLIEFGLLRAKKTPK